MPTKGTKCSTRYMYMKLNKHDCCSLLFRILSPLIVNTQTWQNTWHPLLFTFKITYSLVRVRGRFALLRLSRGVRYTVYTKWPMYYNSHTSNKELKGLKKVPFFFLWVSSRFPLQLPICPRPCYGFYPAKRRINNLISSSCYTDSMLLAFS